MVRHSSFPWFTWLLTLAVVAVAGRLGAALLIGDNAALDHAVSAGWSPAGTILIGAAEIAAAGLLLFPRSAPIGGAALAGVLASTPGAQLLLAEAQPNVVGVLGVAAMSLAVALMRVPELVEAFLAARPAGRQARTPAPAPAPRRNVHEDALEALDGLAGECAGC